MTSAWQCDEVRAGILRVQIDQSDRSVNSFSYAVLDELAELLARIRREPMIRGVLFRSGKPGNFIAGADVNELKDLRFGQAARELSQHGQKIFQELSELPVPTVALISGACLGGGLEFALACTYRIADDDRKTLLGLPEVKLGLIPGWGGTVRLPRTIGLASALPLILTGELLNGRQARACGLVQDVVPTEALDHVGEQIIQRWLEQADCGTAGARRHRHPLFRPVRKPLWKRWLEHNKIAIKLMLRFAEQQIDKKTRGHYPAPSHAIRALRAGMLESAEAGFLAESAAIATLAEHPVTAELMRLFFLREDAKSPPSDLTLPIRPDSIVQAAVIGAGQMGAGIARLLAERAIWVRLKDTKPEYVARGIASLRKAMATELGRRRITPLQATQTLDHVSPTTDYRGMRHAEIVIEAVVEDLSIKQQVFRELAEVTDPRTVLATNTSSLLVSEIATGVPHPERVVGLHFFNPPHQMPLVEVVRTAQTSPEALASALALVQRIGKTAVVVRDSAGFLVNRLLVPYLNEVGYLLAEVSDPMEIERAAIAFGFPMGPLELTDLVGIEVAAHVAENMHRAFGPRMTPAPLWSRLEELHRQNRGRTGKLVQRTWRGGRRLDPVAARMLAKIRRETGQRKTSTYAWDALIERLVYPVVNEAAHCLEERIIEKPEHVDLAMVFGTGFAPFRGGPLRFADRVGLERIVDRLDRWATDHPRLTPCDLLRRLAAQRRGFLDPLPGHSPAAVA